MQKLNNWYKIEIQTNCKRVENRFKSSFLLFLTLKLTVRQMSKMLK